MKVVYVAGAFRGKNAWEIHQNILKAEAVIPSLLARGYAPIVPHLITQNLQGLYPDQVYLDMFLEILRRCDAIYMLDNWHSSKGAREELKLAIKLKKDILSEEIEWK